MNYLNYTSVGFAVAAFAVGMQAAYYWMKASEVEPDPGWRTGPALSSEDAPKPIEPLDDQAKSTDWIAAFIGAGQKSAALNKTAARWTACAVLLGTLSSLAGTVATSF